LEVETTMFKSTYEYSGHGAFVEFRTTIWEGMGFTKLLSFTDQLYVGTESS
jgi:hypothetical protein